MIQYCSLLSGFVIFSMLYKDSLLFIIISSWLAKLQAPLRDSNANKIKEKLHQALTNFHENIFPAFESKKFPGIIFTLRHGWKLYKSYSDLNSNSLVKSYFIATRFLKSLKKLMASAEPTSVEAHALQIISYCFPQQPRQNEIKSIFLKLHQASTSNFIDLFSKEVYQNLSPELEDLSLDMIKDFKILPEHLWELFPGFNHEEFFSKFLSKIPFIKLPQIQHLTLDNYPELSTRGYSFMTYSLEVTPTIHANRNLMKIVNSLPETTELGVIYLIQGETKSDMTYHFKPDSQSTQTGSIRIEDTSSDDAFFLACLNAIQAQGHAQTIFFDAEDAYQKFIETFKSPTSELPSDSTLGLSIAEPAENIQALKDRINKNIRAHVKQLSKYTKEIERLEQQKQNLLNLQSRIRKAQENRNYAPDKACIEMTSSLISLDQKTKQWLEHKHENLSSLEIPKFFVLLQETQNAIERQLEHVEQVLSLPKARARALETQNRALASLKDQANSLNIDNCNTLLEALDDTTWSEFKPPLESWMDTHFAREITRAKQNFLSNSELPQDFPHLCHAKTPSYLREQYSDLKIVRDYLSNPTDLTGILRKLHDGEIQQKILDTHLQNQYQLAYAYYHKKDYSSVISTICFVSESAEILPEIQTFSENLLQVLSDIPTKFSLSEAAQACIERIKEDVNEWKKTQAPFHPQNYNCFQLKIKARLYQIQKDYTKNPTWTVVMDIVIGLLTVGIAHAIKYYCSSNINSLDRLSFFRPQAFSNTLNSLEDTFAKSPLNQNHR